MALISVRQINPTELAQFIEIGSSGAAFSGNIQSYINSSGYMGPLVVWTSGGTQTILGEKRFVTSPLVPYSGGTGNVPSTLFVIERIDTSILSLSGALTGSLVSLTSNQTVLGKKNFTGAVGVGNPVVGTDAVNLAFLSGVSGVLTGSAGGGGGGVGTGYSGYVENNFVNRTTNQSITGNKTFVGTTFFNGGLQTNDLVEMNGPVEIYNDLYIDASGRALQQFVFESNVYVPNVDFSIGGLAVNVETLLSVSGALTGQGGGGDGTTYYITGTGTTNIINTGQTINNTINVTSGNVNTYLTNNIITGNFNSLSFFLDPVATGYNLVESFVAQGFYFTGAAFSCRTSGFGPVNGGILTGRIYQVDQNNTEHILYNFTFSTGMIYSGNSSFNALISGGNRVGISLTNSLSGIQKFSIGVFGGGNA